MVVVNICTASLLVFDVKIGVKHYDKVSLSKHVSCFRFLSPKPSENYVYASSHSLALFDHSTKGSAMNTSKPQFDI